MRLCQYEYEDRINSEDRVNYKTVFSSDGIKIGKVEVAFADSFIVKSEKEKMEIKYETPRLEIASIKDNTITLKLNGSEINQKLRLRKVRCHGSLVHF
jgi:hypothetical protein